VQSIYILNVLATNYFMSSDKTLDNNLVRYNNPAIALHWLMAWLVIATYFIGLGMGEMPVGPDRIKMVGWHKWLGVTIAYVWVVRVIWRATHRAPPQPVGTPTWQIGVSHLVHLLLYILMIAIPLTGWLMSSAKGFTTNYFGLFDLPNLLEKDKALAESLKDVHGFLANSLMALVGLHIAAALKHQLIDKDNLMARMRLPRRGQ
jgi:cytochrome b561